MDRQRLFENLLENLRAKSTRVSELEVKSSPPEQPQRSRQLRQAQANVAGASILIQSKPPLPCIPSTEPTPPLPLLLSLPLLPHSFASEEATTPSHDFNIQEIKDAAGEGCLSPQPEQSERPEQPSDSYDFTIQERSNDAHERYFVLYILSERGYGWFCNSIRKPESDASMYGAWISWEQADAFLDGAARDGLTVKMEEPLLTPLRWTTLADE